MNNEARPYRLAHSGRVVQDARLEAGGSERAPAGEGGRRAYRVHLIHAGRVRAQGNRPGGLVIPAEALRQAVQAGLFEGRASFLDHAGSREYPSLHDLVGVTGEAAWDEAGQAVEAVIWLYESPAAKALGEVLDEMLSDAAAGRPVPDVGLSLVFWPRWAPKASPEDPLVLAEIKHVESCDFVFEPGAGGKIIQKLISIERIHEGCTGGDTMTDPLTNNPNSESTTRNTSAQTTAETRESSPAAASRLSSSAPETRPPGTLKQGSRQSEAGSLSDWVGALADSLIANSGLPPASRKRLAQQLGSGGGELSTPSQVQAAIEAEQAYLAELNASQVVQIGGQAPRSAHISLGRSGLEQVQLALQALVAGGQPPSGVAPLSGLREAYVLLSGDYEMTGLFHPERVQLANVTSATMAGLVADALNKRVANLFQEYPRWWEKIVAIEDFTTLQQVKWITLGGVGELPTVAEGAAYTELTWDDQTETASFVKKGGYLGITLEAMDKDDTRRLQAAPRALAQAAWLTLSKAVSGIFTAASGTGPTLSDSKALFHADHGNLGSTALSFSAYAAARTAMRKQTELNSTERLGALTAPRYLLVPPDLEITALQVLASEGEPATPNNQANPFAEGNSFDARLNAARERVIVVDLWTDSNDWAAAADPRLYPSIGLGFRYGRAPEIFSVASPTAGLMFSNDTLPVKARFFFAAGPIDYRGLYKANVSA